MNVLQLRDHQLHLCGITALWSCIGSRSLWPLLGLVNPLHTQHMPDRVTANSGFDVLCHALESCTAILFNERTPRPSNPIERPAYQGSNPTSGIYLVSTEDHPEVHKKPWYVIPYHWIGQVIQNQGL
ncbi:hydroxyacid-oxoacid transhydrogenase, mitochondrial-like [Ptychodera flava]|uniref:hydroxyacid-oxoacid transhydrogenase, mitochondrial-like n=1 Tax=Ptychodera flava TaxID=63121 RepID=UPI003969C4CD